MIEYPEIMVACIHAANTEENDIHIEEVGAAAVALYHAVVDPFDEHAPNPNCRR